MKTLIVLWIFGVPVIIEVPPEKPVAGEIVTVTPDGGKTHVRLRRTERPDRFQFVP